MAIKYQCPKCGRRFVDWGAEKLGFMCPDDEGVELVRVGTGDDASPSPRRSSSKKAPRRVAAVAAVDVDEEAVDEDEFEAAEAEDAGDDETEGDEEVAVDETVVDDAVPVDDDVEADADADPDDAVPVDDDEE